MCEASRPVSSFPESNRRCPGFHDATSSRVKVSRETFFELASGFHVTAGLRFPLGDDFSLVAEGRYLWAKTDMGEDFRENEIDLGGPSATIGINLRF